MGFTGMFSVETVLKIIGFGVKVGIIRRILPYKTYSLFLHTIFIVLLTYYN